MRKILVIDDEQRIADILEGFLTKMGFEVAKAYGGEKGIEVLNSGKALDLVICDMKMPKVNGLEVIRNMIKLGLKTPVIILTGSIEAEKYLYEVESLGFKESDLAYKPVDLFALLGLIKNKLGMNEQG